MIGMRATIIDKTQEVHERVNRISFNSLKQAGYEIRRSAIKSIKKTRKRKPSPAGRPPRTRRGRRLSRAIFYAAEKDGLSVIIGPVASRMGIVGEAHEHGRMYMGAKYPARPFMGPALAENLDRIPSYWTHS